MQDPGTDGLSDDEVQDFFGRAGELDDASAMLGLYQEWAPVYDQTIAQFGRYLSPDRIADMAARLCSRDVPVLDLACGTGLLGQALAGRGFTNLTGVDLSAPMLARAAGKGCSARLGTADLSGPWPFEAGAFGLVTCAGAFLHGHLGADVLSRAVAGLPPGGLLLADVEAGTFEAEGYAGVLAGLEAAGAEVALEEGHFYAPAEGEPAHGWFVTVRV